MISLTVIGLSAVLVVDAYELSRSKLLGVSSLCRLMGLRKRRLATVGGPADVNIGFEFGSAVEFGPVVEFEPVVEFRPVVEFGSVLAKLRPVVVA